MSPVLTPSQTPYTSHTIIEIMGKFSKMIDVVSTSLYLYCIHVAHDSFAPIGERTHDVLRPHFSPQINNTNIVSSTKLSLYSGLHSSITEHRTVLADREKDLKDVRESLVRDGANVVGGMNKTSEQSTSPSE